MPTAADMLRERLRAKPECPGCAAVSGLGAATAALTAAEVDRIRQLQLLAGEALNRIDAALSSLEKAAGWFKSQQNKDKLALYRKTAAFYRTQYDTANTDPGVYRAFWTDPARVTKYMSNLELFAGQVRAAAEGASVSFWDGFWESLGRRTVEVLGKIPNPDDVLDKIPWVAIGIVGVAVIVLVPLLRTLVTAAPAPAPTVSGLAYAPSPWLPRPTRRKKRRTKRRPGRTAA